MTETLSRAPLIGRRGFMQTMAASLAAVLASPRFAKAALPPQVNAAFFLSTSPFMMAKGEGSLEASMAKAYVCRAAEWVTREAMQIHGGMGYAEEFPVSRYFVDARVLSIFEGADETLALKVVARRLVEQAV